MIAMRQWLVAYFLLCAAGLHAQGTVRGTVRDRSGETLIGTSVEWKGHAGKGTATDYDGMYSMAIDAAGPVVLVFTAMGYQMLERTVEVKAGQVVILDVTLSDKNEVLQEFEVTGKARRDGETYLEHLKINSPTAVDYISGDQMLRSGDGDASSAVKRVTGVSTVGAFVTVRGLADRYIVTTVNGMRVPTLDPLTNNLRLDLFASGMLDNIVITKTASPDLPGDWCGALVSMNTSDYPQRLRVRVGTTLGFNPNSSFTRMLTAQRSSTDWLGFDDGSRAVPDGVPEDIEDFPQFIEPNLYQQLQFLGLGSWMQGYGITPNTPGFQGTTMGTGSVLQHLALTELGLLAPALLYDGNAVSAAVYGYNGTYDLAYFSPTMNAGLAALNTRFDNSHWRLSEEQGRPNINQSFSIGNQVGLFKQRSEPMTLGFLFGFRYASETEYDPGSTFTRTGEPFADPHPGDAYGKTGTQRIATESNGWNAVGNLSLKIDRNNSVGLMVMPNLLGQNNARYQVFLQPGTGSETYASEDQYYEQRALWVYQLTSTHVLPGLNNLRAELSASYSDGDRDLLDLKTVQYVLPPEGQPISDVEAALGSPSRIYRYMDETLLDTRVSFELPLSLERPKAYRVKVGGGYMNDTRRNKQSFFTVLGAPGPTQWEDAGRFELNEAGRFVTRYAPFGTFKDNDIGINEITSAFAMGDMELTPRLRLAGGLRMERTHMITDILRFWENGVAADDTIRGTVGDVAIGGASNPEPQPAVPGVIDRSDLLPSINLIYTLGGNEDAPLNLRLGWFRSLGRPSFREFSVVQQFDYLLSAPVYGNPNLEMTRVSNYDLRLERFFEGGDNVSLSGFYKEFTDHIELLYTLAGGYTWRNADRSVVYGTELEGRIGITKNLEWRGNLTLMYSRSDLTTVLTAEPTTYSTRMYGQAPYIVNTMFNYTSDSARFGISVSYNLQGPKLAISNSEVNPDGIRAYEMPRHLLDVTVSKDFGAHWGVRLRGRNLLNAPQRRAYLFDSGYDVDFDKYTYGTEYSLTLSYTLK